MAGAMPFAGRREDRRLVTGSGLYTGDVDLPGQLHAAFVRSDRGHAIIRAVDSAAAKKHIGVVAVYAAADIAGAGFKPPGTMAHAPGRGGTKIIVPVREMLARDRVRHVGEEVALVIAESAGAAQDAAEHIVVDYEDLPAVAHPVDAVKPGAPQIYANIPGNVAYDYEYGDEAATQAAFSAAQHVVRLQLDSQRMSPVPMEPRSVLAGYDGATDSWDLFAQHQGQSMFKPGLVQQMGITPDRIRLHSKDIGGGFGARSNAYAEHVLLMWASKQLKRPIKWVGSRSESFLTETHGRGIVMDVELALDKDGTFRAFRMNWFCDTGAYMSGAGPFTNTQNGVVMITGAYRVPAAYGRHRCVITNTCPTGPFRGASRPEAAYAVERLVDQAAIELGMDRIAIRRKNVIPREAFPYTTPTKTVYDSGDPAGLLDQAIAKSGWAAFEARRAEAKARGKVRGIGLALFFEPAGGGAVPKDQVALRFDADAKISLHAVTQNHGQGHETVFPEIVASVLGIPAERVTLTTESSLSSQLLGNGVVGSRTTQQFGSAYKLGAIEVVKKGTQLASKRLEAAADDIEFSAGEYRVKGTDRRVALLDLAREHHTPTGNALDADAEAPVLRAFPSGAHVAEIEIDPDTGEIDVVRYTAVDDSGNILNHTLVEGQVHGAIVQEAGHIFGEHGEYDRSTGQFLTGSFMDYFMPRAGLVPEIDVSDRPMPSPSNFLGAKGAGEAGATGAMPTFMNAIVDALRPLGIEHFDMPATPARVWAAIQSAHSSQRH